MPYPGESILDSVKKVIGFEPDYDAFDIDLIMHINSVFATLNQLGVGPSLTFSITDGSSVWSDFIGDATATQSVRSYVYMKVRLAFDPPATSFAIAAFENQIKEYEWRLMTVMDPVIPDVLTEIEVEPIW